MPTRIIYNERIIASEMFGKFSRFCLDTILDPSADSWNVYRVKDAGTWSPDGMSVEVFRSENKDAAIAFIKAETDKEQDNEPE